MSGRKSSKKSASRLRASQPEKPTLLPVPSAPEEKKADGFQLPYITELAQKLASSEQAIAALVKEFNDSDREYTSMKNELLEVRGQIVEMTEEHGNKIFDESDDPEDTKIREDYEELLAKQRKIRDRMVNHGIKDHSKAVELLQALSRHKDEMASVHVRIVQDLTAEVNRRPAPPAPSADAMASTAEDNKNAVEMPTIVEEPQPKKTNGAGKSTEPVVEVNGTKKGNATVLVESAPDDEDSGTEANE